MPKYQHVSGGKRLDRFFRDVKQAAARQPVVEVGFKGSNPLIRIIANKLEFGDPDDNLPERPAFRQGVQRLKAELPGEIAKRASGRGKDSFQMTDEDARHIAVFARDIMRQSYLDFRGPGLSDVQRSRKRGTQYEDDELVGREGPKLVDNHLLAFVDGREVG